MAHTIRRTVVSAHDLVVKRGRSFVLRVPLLQLTAGETTWIIGRHGCGKTTLLQALASCIRAQRNTVLKEKAASGGSVKPHKVTTIFVGDSGRLAFALQRFMVLRQLRPPKDTRRNRSQGSEDDVGQRTRAIAAALRFTPPRNWFSRLAPADKSKLRLVYALMHRAQVILLDEPLHELDARDAKAVQKLVQAEADRGAAVVVATHELQWATEAADRIVLLVAGNLVLAESKRALMAKYGSLEYVRTRII